MNKNSINLLKKIEKRKRKIELLKALQSNQSSTVVFSTCMKRRRKSIRHKNIEPQFTLKKHYRSDEKVTKAVLMAEKIDRKTDPLRTLGIKKKDSRVIWPMF